MTNKVDALDAIRTREGDEALFLPSVDGNKNSNIEKKPEVEEVRAKILANLPAGHIFD